jgi:hypothetical protein
MESVFDSFHLVDARGANIISPNPKSKRQAIEICLCTSPSNSLSCPTERNLAWHSNAGGCGVKGQRADEAESWYVREREREEINSLISLSPSNVQIQN